MRVVGWVGGDRREGEEGWDGMGVREGGGLSSLAPVLSVATVSRFASKPTFGALHVYELTLFIMMYLSLYPNVKFQFACNHQVYCHCVKTVAHAYAYDIYLWIVCFNLHRDFLTAMFCLTCLSKDQG